MRFGAKRPAIRRIALAARRLAATMSPRMPRIVAIILSLALLATTTAARQSWR
jgi:hypothetical protein